MIERSYGVGLVRALRRVFAKIGKRQAQMRDRRVYGVGRVLELFSPNWTVTATNERS